MSVKKYNKSNFHKHTFCEFTEVEASTIPTIEWQYKSKSGSGYCFTAEGVYRSSNHWGRAANCRWRLISSTKVISKINNSQNRIGYAKWTDFYQNNEIENIFYTNSPSKVVWQIPPSGRRDSKSIENIKVFLK